VFHGGAIFEPGVHPLVHLFIEKPWQVLLLPLLHAELKLLLRVDSCALVEVCNLFVIREEHLLFMLACKCISMTLVGFIYIELHSQL
jgi:hypothetical protein